MAREQLCNELATERQVARLLEMVEPVDLARDRRDALVASHAAVVDVDDLLEDEDLGEEQEVLLARRELLLERQLLLGVDLARITHAEASEIAHVLILFVEEVVQVGGDHLLVATVEPPGESLDQHALAVDVQAEEVDGLEEAEPLALRLAELFVGGSAEERDELGARVPGVLVDALGPFDPRVRVDALLDRHPAEALDGRLKRHQTFSTRTHCQLSP